MAKKPRKPIKSFDERYLDRLESLCQGEDIAISNAQMRKSLGWSDDRYDKVRTSLLAKNLIKPAQGQGGKVRFVNFPGRILPKKSLKIFIAYSHNDDEIKNELIKHLRPLEHLNMVETWHDRQIKPGEEFSTIISKNIDTSDIIILLISIDFINSDYCYGIELKRAMERHAEGEAKVIPIIARQCLWHHAPFGSLQALPEDGKAIATWLDRDSALTTVAESIYNMAKQLPEAENK